MSHYRLIGCILLTTVLFLLIWVRQYNQWLFTEIQSVIQEERIEQESLNEHLIQYLEARQQVIEWADAQGYVLRKEA